MIQIVVPMAGKGSRFVKAGYELPKPFIDVAGKPMIQRVVENLMPYEPHRFIFIARREHEGYIKQHMSFATDVVYLDEVTEGAACTVLKAKEKLWLTEPLIIANSDQLVVWNTGEDIETSPYPAEIDTIQFAWKESNSIQDFINDARLYGEDGAIATFGANHPKWSYVRTEGGVVKEVAEKRVISNEATVGVYYFQSAFMFVDGAYKMIRDNKRVNGEFYVCPVFNELVDKYKIGTYWVDKMIGLGTPEDLTKALSEGYFK